LLTGKSTTPEANEAVTSKASLVLDPQTKYSDFQTVPRYGHANAADQVISATLNMAVKNFCHHLEVVSS